MPENGHPHGLFVTGIDTGVGKTLVSALLVRCLEASYWKPVQAGDLHDSDSLKVRSLTGFPASRIHPEGIRLKTPMSPHAAAARENRRIGLSDLELPRDEQFLVVEGAGGLLVPLNDRETIFDLIKKLGLPVVLVSRHYLGSINHTLLSLDLLRRHGLPLRALVFNGDPDPETEEAILARTDSPDVLRLPRLAEVNREALSDVIQAWSGTTASWLSKN